MIREPALGIAARVWCQPETSNIEMDVRLAREFAKIIDAYRDTLDKLAEDFLDSSWSEVSECGEDVAIAIDKLRERQLY